MRTLILGSSGGIGSALVRACSALGDEVFTLSRSQDGLDVTREDSVIECVSAIPEGLERVINTVGILTTDGQNPERRMASIDPDVMARMFAVNALGAALVLKHVSPKLATDGRTVFATLSARLASIGDNGLGGWTSYRASKAALNQIIRCAAIELSRKRRQSVVVGLHPGTIETDMTRKFARGRYTASADEAAQQLLTVLDELGAKDSGGFFDYAGKAIPF
ncbi:MAG: NAD(P)-dependent dehydrogenase (short-subunit alcohol dehydrogenase family) [Myxococcota bacterium]|jgi:NAD(P)-dependent dehydrogenase (short-subunit alcohol dehydrogenase family)